MTRELSHHDMQELLAAYALDAVAGDEAEAIELHLRECPRCRAEVAEHRETAAFLAIGHQPAPTEVWERIATGLDDAPPPGALVVPLAGRPRRRALQIVVASVAAAIVALLGVVVVQQGRRLNEMQVALQDRTLVSVALAAHGRPDARRVELRSGNGVVLAHAVLTPDGTGFVWSGGLPPVAADRTYQLWAVVGGATISAGVLGADPELVPFHVSGNVAALAITEERAGGVAATQEQPVVIGRLEQA